MTVANHSLICSKILSRVETFHVKRHYNLCHKKNYENYDNETKLRLLQELKFKHTNSLQKYINKNMNLS